MTSNHNIPGTDPALNAKAIADLIEAFSQIGKCACAVLDPQKHVPVVSTGWRPQWEEFSSILPHVPERLFAALSKLNWADLANRPVMKFESAGHIMHAIAAVHTNGTLRCFLYAGYILGSRPDEKSYTELARDRKFDVERFLHVVNELPVLAETALTASLARLVSQANTVLEQSATVPPAQPVQPQSSEPVPSSMPAAPWTALEETLPPPWQASAAPKSEPTPQKKPKSAEKTAVSESDMHSQIIRSLTRDIRTALNGSIGVTGMLMRRRDPEVTELLDTVHRSNDTLLTMLDNLHDYYDVISHQMPFKVAPFDVRIATERAVEAVRKRIEETGLKLQIRFTEDIPKIVVGDAARFQQVLKNALLTVSRYSVGERVVLAARKNGTNTEDCELQFLVRNIAESNSEDTPSIDDDEAVKVYDSADIGMVVSKEIIQLLGGKMVFHTTEPPSAIFSLVMPELHLEGYTFDTAISQILQRTSMMVIDDNETELAALSLQCGYWGPYVKTITKADSAYEWLMSHEPVDALIISHTTPMKDAFLEKLKSSRVYADLPAVVYAGNIPASQLKTNGSGESHAVWETLRETLERVVSNVRDSGPKPDTVSTLAELYPNSILVVEDDAMNRQLVDRILKKLGYTAVLASNGIEAVKEASKKQFDLVFMDLQMPGMDGITAAKTIMNDTIHDTPPRIIALSANASHSDREGAFKAGMIDFIAKPIILNKLQDAIAKWGVKASGNANTPADSSTDGPALIDVDVISQTRELDQFAEESVLDRLISGFIKEVPPIIDELEKGFTANNTYKVTKATSTLIGMCRNLGVKEFAVLAKDINNTASSADLVEMTTKLKKLKLCYQNTCAELKLYLSGPL